MSIPDSSHPCWGKLADGGATRIRTQHLGMQLLIKRLERSSESPSQKAGEFRSFFAKWEPTLGSEIQQLARL